MPSPDAVDAEVSDNVVEVLSGRDTSVSVT